MSVRGAFHVEDDRPLNEAVKKWKKTWEAQLKPAQKCIYDFMREDRRREIHTHGGSRRGVESKEIKVGVGGSYSDKSGTLTSWDHRVPCSVLTPGQLFQCLNTFSTYAE